MHLRRDDLPNGRANKKRGLKPALFVKPDAGEDYLAAAAAVAAVGRSVFFSTMRADLPRRLRR